MTHIIRHKRSTNFTVVSNDTLNDPRLSWQATGMLVYLLSLPDDWKIMIAHLTKQKKNGRDAVYSIIRELTEAGYIVSERATDENGRFAGTNYIVYDTPQNVGAEEVAPHPENPDTEKPDAEKPYTGNPDTENPTLLRTKETRTKELRTKKEKERKKEPTPAQVSPSNKKTFEILINEYTTDADLRQAIWDFIAMRVNKKAKPTNRALELIFKDLDKLARSNGEKVAILEQSIKRNWTGVFPLSEDAKKKVVDSKFSTKKDYDFKGWEAYER